MVYCPPTSPVKGSSPVCMEVVPLGWVRVILYSDRGETSDPPSLIEVIDIVPFGAQWVSGVVSTKATGNTD